MLDPSHMALWPRVEELTSRYRYHIIVISETVISRSLAGAADAEDVTEFYRDDDGTVPVLEWLTELSKRKPKAYTKCVYLLEVLQEFGSELRRPRADYLRDGIYELRTMVGNVHYRILYSFVGKNVAVLAAGLTKEKAVPAKEIDRAVMRVAKYNSNPSKYGYTED